MKMRLHYFSAFMRAKKYFHAIPGALASTVFQAATRTLHWMPALMPDMENLPPGPGRLVRPLPGPGNSLILNSGRCVRL
ncbi:MAG: hypothetical protein U0938_06505 [Thiobacillus sp.]|nr:hypothetical protein [Thiobacillus sp.]